MKEAILSARFRFDGSGPEKPLGPKAESARRAVAAEMEAGAWAFESRPCFCGSSEHTLIATRERYGLRHPTVVCRRCGLIRAEPRPDLAAYAAFYAEHYRALYGDEDVHPDELYRVRVEQGRRTHEFITARLGRKPRLVLDVGCNQGTMLLPFHEKGCEVFGVDYGGEFVRRGRARTGIAELHQGGVEVFLATGRKADLIVCSHVVEHFLDLEADVAKLSEALSDDGALFVAVPGTRHYTEVLNKGDFLALLQNAHTFQFDPDTLDYVMGCCGFTRLAGDDEIQSLYVRSGTRRSKDDLPPGGHDAALAYLRGVERRYLPRLWAKRALDRLGLKAPLKKILGR